MEKETGRGGKRGTAAKGGHLLKKEQHFSWERERERVPLTLFLDFELQLLLGESPECVCVRLPARTPH